MTKPLFRPFLTLLFLIFSNQVFAEAKWLVVHDDERIVYYIDSNSVKKNNQFAKVWSLIEYKTAKQNGYFLAKSVLSLEEYDCKEDRIRTLSQTQYTGSMGQGEKLSIDLSNEKWGYVAPNTISDSIEKFVCKKKG